MPAADDIGLARRRVGCGSCSDSIRIAVSNPENLLSPSRTPRPVWFERYSGAKSPRTLQFPGLTDRDRSGHHGCPWTFATPPTSKIAYLWSVPTSAGSGAHGSSSSPHGYTGSPTGAGDSGGRFWGAIPELGDRYLRVVTLEDKVTVLNAFPDRRFEP